MINCPICKKEIASDATTCPHCGHPLKKIEHLETLLKREHASYILDILIMLLPLSLIALMIINNYLLILAIPISLTTIIWGSLSLKKRMKNNIIVKDLIYLNKDTNEIKVYTIDNREFTYPINLISKIHKENLITQRVFITIKEINNDHITYHTHKLDLGYAKSEEVKSLAKKLKELNITLSVDE